MKDKTVVGDDSGGLADSPTPKTSGNQADKLVGLLQDIVVAEVQLGLARAFGTDEKLELWLRRRDKWWPELQEQVSGLVGNEPFADSDSADKPTINQAIHTKLTEIKAKLPEKETPEPSAGGGFWDGVYTGRNQAIDQVNALLDKEIKELT